MSDASVLDIASMFRTRRADQQARFDAVDQLLDAFWDEGPDDPGHGYSDGELLITEARLGHPLPAVLRLLYQRWGRCRGLSTQDHLVPPSDLESTDGYLVFRRENQNCAAWGVRLEDNHDDPLVHLQEDPSRGLWRPDGGRVSDFAVHLALYEAAFAPAHTANRPVDDTDRALTTVEVHFEELAVPPFLWWPGPELAPIRFFGGKDVLIADHCRTWIWATALTPAALETVCGQVPGNWQREG